MEMYEYSLCRAFACTAYVDLYTQVVTTNTLSINMFNMCTIRLPEYINIRLKYQSCVG